MFGKHPRLRGEDGFAPVALSYITETPPLTRGRLRESFDALPSQRNTPAYAGKTFTQCLALAKLWKHPRLRGEDEVHKTARPRLSETPPLTRGRPRMLDQEALAKRNTPAYAGKTQGARHWCRPGQKHPRLRGEDVLLWTYCFSCRETPPLTRGRPFDCCSSCFLRRNTPAYAGKTRP